MDWLERVDYVNGLLDEKEDRSNVYDVLSLTSDSLDNETYRLTSSLKKPVIECWLTSVLVVGRQNGYELSADRVAEIGTYLCDIWIEKVQGVDNIKYIEYYEINLNELVSEDGVYDYLKKWDRFDEDYILSVIRHVQK